ncbi:MAG: complex I NDUFA9 subunit family protein [Alphaproteobacteria bacterium]|nr:complex I NDUFA9 subunit family protein [Alphaproteobacteria bacterium]
MSSLQPIATVFGGTGFIGRQIVRQLAQRGYIVKVATRMPERAYFLRPCGTVGQVVPFACRPNDPQSLAAAVAGSDVVINTIGILYERGRQTFHAAHVEIPAAIAAACTRASVKYFVHFSALGVERSAAKYARSKIAGEKAILQYFPNATILRPSLVFGEDDNFFNRFARLAQWLPGLPLIGGGFTKFQPVYVGDLATAAMAALKPRCQGQIYELGGPEILDFKKIFERIFEFTGQRLLFPLPFGLALVQAWFLNLLPEPLLTPDQVELLKTDNIVNYQALSFKDLGIQPTALGVILPRYMESYRPGGRFGALRTADGAADA